MKHTVACPAGFQISQSIPGGLSLDDEFDPTQQPALELAPGGKHLLSLPNADAHAEELDTDPSHNPWAECPDEFDLYDAFTAQAGRCV